MSTEISHGANWTDAELSATVEIYLQFQRHQAAGTSFSKKEAYRELANRFGRTDKAFEFRCQNISAVLLEHGEQWVAGLKPAAHVGDNVSGRLWKILQSKRSVAGRPSNAPYIAKLPKIRQWLIGVARDRHKVTYSELMTCFGIDRFCLRHAMDRLGHQARDAGEPVITALIVSKGTGRCSDGLAKEFGVLDDEAERELLFAFWANAEPIDDEDGEDDAEEDLEQRAQKFARAAIRPDQAPFRKRVFKACKGRCVVSGCEVSKALDAAHRPGRDWRKGHNKETDGYLLRKDLHALHDAKLLQITAEGVVQLSPMLLPYYQDLQGRRVKLSRAKG